jgi:hypothetical protein
MTTTRFLGMCSWFLGGFVASFLELQLAHVHGMYITDIQDINESRLKKEPVDSVNGILVTINIKMSTSKSSHSLEAITKTPKAYAIPTRKPSKNYPPWPPWPVWSAWHPDHALLNYTTYPRYSSSRMLPQQSRG